LCETRTRNFLTRLKPSGEMFVEEAWVYEIVREFVHSFRRMET
jgi:hypothetical protein